MDYTNLLKDKSGKVSKVGIVGATKGYGYTLLAQIPKVAHMELRVICSRHLEECEEVLKETITLVNAFVKDVEVGEIYNGRVVNIAKFGAFMEILPGKEGLLHVSEISNERVANVEDVLKVGDRFDVKVISTENGKISLSKKKI